MECKLFEDHLRECVEQHRSPEIGPFAVHLDSCPACQREWTHWQVLDRAISEWNDLGDTPDLSSRVLSELAHGAPRHQSPQTSGSTRRTTARWVMISTAALLLIGIVPLVVNFVIRQQDLSNSLAQQDLDDKTLQPVGKPLESDDPSWEQLVGNTRTVYTNLLDEVGIQPPTFPKEIPPPTPDPPETDLDHPTSVGLLTRDLRASVGFLGRLLPDSKSTQ